MEPSNISQLKWSIIPGCLPDISKGDFDTIAIYREKTHRSIHRYAPCLASHVIDFQGEFIAWMPAPALPKEAE